MANGSDIGSDGPTFVGICVAAGGEELPRVTSLCLLHRHCSESIPQLTWKNRPLPVSDERIARPWLLQAEKELACTNHEIQQLDPRHSTLLSAVEVYRVALAPHKLLPIDVLREIFLSAARPLPANLNLVVSSHFGLLSEIRLVLCQICSHWRSIALETPELWSDVRIDFPFTPSRCLLEVFRIWLTRSGQRALSLHVTGVTKDATKEQLACHSHRFRSLCIRPDNPFLALPAGAVDRLETLELDGEGVHAPFRPMTVFAGAPSLSSVTLRSFEFQLDSELSAINIPWHQLTELYIHTMGLPPPEYYSILDGANALTTAHLGILLPYGVAFALAHRNIVLPRLETLVLNGGDLSIYAGFLNCIILPSLEDLTLFITGSALDTIFSVPTLSIVRRLCIDAGDGDPMVLPWLCACASAVEVCLRYYYMPDSMLDQIADGTLLPHVEMLTVWSANPGPLIHTLQARQRNPNHSQITETGTTLYSNFSKQLSMHDVDALAELMMSGVFLCNFDFEGYFNGPIEKRSRREFETGSGVFERADSLP
ncbi:hypothetical protein C8R44DRAFT_846132 [Mycena epipterygia]|nr:hypothetical protein C8R44DRAFT_846132 [Mycena epipterygia]